MAVVQAIRYSKPLNKCSTCIKTVYTHNCGHMIVRNSETLLKKTCRQCFPPVTSRISMQSRPVTTYTLKNVPLRGTCRKRDCPAREFEEYENLRTCNTCSYEFVEYACHVIPKSNGEEEGSGKLCETCDFLTQGGRIKIPESRPKTYEDKSTYTLKHCSYCRVRECSKCEALLTEYLCGHSIWRPFLSTRQSEPCLTCHLDDKIPSTTNPYWVYKKDNSRECDACEIKQSSWYISISLFSKRRVTNARLLRNTSPAPDTFSSSETRQLSTTFEESSRKDPSQSPFKTKTTIKIEHQDSYESTPSLERSSRRDRYPEASRST